MFLDIVPGYHLVEDPRKIMAQLLKCFIHVTLTLWLCVAEIVRSKY